MFFKKPACEGCSLRLFKMLFWFPFCVSVSLWAGEAVTISWMPRPPGDGHSRLEDLIWSWGGVSSVSYVSVIAISLLQGLDVFQSSCSCLSRTKTNRSGAAFLLQRIYVNRSSFHCPRYSLSTCSWVKTSVCSNWWLFSSTTKFKHVTNYSTEH